VLQVFVASITPTITLHFCATLTEIVLKPFATVASDLGKLTHRSDHARRQATNSASSRVKVFTPKPMAATEDA